MKREWRYTLLVALPLIVIGIADVLVQETTYAANLSGALQISSFLVSIIYVYMLIVLLGGIVQDKAQIDFKAARAWAAKQWWPLVWVYLLVLTAVIGGIILFIIPGLLLSILLYFSFFAVAVDGHRGVRALQESRRLFKGRFFEVFLKILGLGAINLFLFFVAIIVATVLAVSLPAVGGEMTFVLLGTAFAQVLAAVITVISLRSGFSLYQAAKSTTDAPAGSVWPDKFFVLLGILAPLLLLGSLLYLYDGNFDNFIRELESTTTSEEAAMQVELRAAGVTATTYQISNGSYDGVCAVLRDSVAAGGVTACNDTTEAYALTLQAGEKTWCVDSSGYNKTIASPLAERVSCLPL